MTTAGAPPPWPARRRRLAKALAFVAIVAGLLGLVWSGRGSERPTPPRPPAPHRPARAAAPGDDAVALFRLERDEAENEAIARLQEVLGNPSLPAATRQAAGAAFLAALRRRRAELEAEDLLTAKGFADVAVLLTAARAFAVTPGFPRSSGQAMAIAYTVHEATGVPWTAVAVVPAAAADRLFRTSGRSGRIGPNIHAGE